MLKTKYHHFNIYLCHTDEELRFAKLLYNTSYIMTGPGNSTVYYRCALTADRCRTCPIEQTCSVEFLKATGHALYSKHINTFKKLA